MSENEQVVAQALTDIFEILDSLEDEKTPLGAANYLFLYGNLEETPFTIFVARNERAEPARLVLANLVENIQEGPLP